MDLAGVFIILIVSLSGIFMIVGPIIEARGHILLEKPKSKPRYSGRYGIGTMFGGGALFVVGLLLRTNLTSQQVTPMVVGGYILWFLGGIIALIRNESLRY